MPSLSAKRKKRRSYKKRKYHPLGLFLRTFSTCFPHTFKGKVPFAQAEEVWAEMLRRGWRRSMVNDSFLLAMRNRSDLQLLLWSRVTLRIPNQLSVLSNHRISHLPGLVLNG